MDWTKIPLAVALTLGLSSSAYAFEIVEKRDTRVLPTIGHAVEVTTYTLRTREGETLASIARGLTRKKLMGERVINIPDEIVHESSFPDDFPDYDLSYEKQTTLRGVYAQLEHWNPQVKDPLNIPAGMMLTYKVVKSTPVFNNIW